MSGVPASDPLAALRPLHAPAAVAWWPPAPGWWLLAAVVLLLPALVWWYRRRWWLRRAALAELQQLAQTVTDDGQLAAAVNQLLRRVALACFPHRQVAALSGEAWLGFLDAHLDGAGFSSGPGRALLTAPYQAAPHLDREALLALARHWVRRQRGGRS
jgi:hypothetical protein